jgi:hypothetical protein
MGPPMAIPEREEGRPAQAAHPDDPSSGKDTRPTVQAAGTEILADRIDVAEPLWVVELRLVEARVRVAAMYLRRRVIREIRDYLGEHS